ncbi:class I SAM-dependent methyltransferase [Pleurocapsa sp. FMAR1]|uniref:class I SAM-dependent methyltransferase n=1 Tax=Pleurocapsa sp. FMAR1 TaxID=3040204 RepID=UPI0029C9888D|nr:class I SAM-dependent methyltransferase [Pleurocapsa sp. FMAR1]
MQNQEPFVFDQERASAYDKRFAKLAPLNGVLHLLTRALLSELPANARVLCVGVGTGAELINLAQAFPQWQFTAVEPATPMLNICRQQAEKTGIASRCTFYEGYLDSLPTSDAFDAVTCFVVLYFLFQPDERRSFLRQIASRLRPNGYLVMSTLAADMSTSTYKSLFEFWLRMLKSEVAIEEVEKFRTSYGKDVAILSPREVESAIASSGFDAPVLFLQTLLLHAWYAKRSA